VATGHFTSHIVQIKHVVLNCRQVSKLLLYIPHSSDKTVEEPNVSEVWENFTSHIVQIKLPTYPAPQLKINHFTSHIVQIKRQNSLAYFKRQTKCFTSHIVQIKRGPGIDITPSILDFTSHIVQIKRYY